MFHGFSKHRFLEFGLPFSSLLSPVTRIYIYIPDISEMYLPASFPGLSHFFFSPRLLPVIYYIDDPRPIVSVTAV